MHLLHGLEQFDSANVEIDLGADSAEHRLLFAGRAMHFKSAHDKALDHVVYLLLGRARLHGNNHLRSLCLLVHFKIKFGFAGRLGGCGAMNLLLLQLAHDIDDALKDVLDLTIRKRTLVCLFHSFEDVLLPLRLINGKIRVVLQLADLPCRRSALVDQLYQFEIQLIDFLTPVFYGHFAKLSACASLPARSPRINVATGSADFVPCFSMIETIALPIAAASANSPTV